MGIVGPHFLTLATYLTSRQTKKNSVVLGVSLVVWGLQWSPVGSQVCKFGPLDPAEERQDQGRVVGGDTGLSVPHTSHIFDA